MPVEVRELIIKVSVDNAPPPNPPLPGAGEQQASSDETMMAACVEQVLQVLENKKER